jgi:formate-dependent nitrite reductase membrane component NrfD
MNGEEPRSGDGRNVEPTLGILAGEASEQTVPSERASEGAPPFAVWQGVPSQDGWRADDPTYFERPVLKQPVWIWAIPAYFYAGGAAGAAAVLGAVAQVADPRGLRRLVGRCRWITAIGAWVGTGLLIHDLGRPERFLNMLRVFRPTSPLSVGSWILAAETPLATGSAVLSGTDGMLRGTGDVAGLAAGVVGLPLAGYTAVLLSNTAIPVWQETRRTLPGLFYASAASSAASILEVTNLGDREERVVHRFGVAAKASELVAAAAVEREAAQVERVKRPLSEGVSGLLWQTAKAMTAASLVVSLLPGRSRMKRWASALLGTGGAVAVRFAVFHAGKASAQDPRATFQQQREGHGAAARPVKAGAARRLRGGLVRSAGRGS